MLALTVALGLSACGQLGSSSGEFEPRTKDTLTVVTQPLPTAGFWEGTARRPTGGFSYGMARDLADRLGLRRLVIRERPFSEIVAGKLGDADLALALITPTDGRREHLDFSDPFIQASPALVTRKGTSVPDVETAKGLRFALPKNTTFVDLVAELIHPDEKPLTYENRQDMIAAVLDGRADVTVFDMPAAVALVDDEPELEIASKFDGTEPIAAALPKGSDNTEAVSSQLRAMGSDGTIDALARRWLGESLTDSENDAPLLRTNQR